MIDHELKNAAQLLGYKLSAWLKTVAVTLA